MNDWKKNYFKISFFLIFVVLFSCKKRNAESALEKDIPIYNLKFKETGIRPLGSPKVKLVNDFLFTLDIKDSVVFKVYNQEFKLVDGKYKLSEFPLDLKFPTFSTSRVDSKHESISVYDLAKLNLIKFSPKIILDDFYWNVEMTALSNLEYHPKSIIYYSDTLAIYVPEVGGSLVIEKAETNSVKFIPYSFHLFDKIKPSNIPYVFQSVAATNFDKNIIAIAPILTGEIEFYDFSGLLLKSVVYDSINHNIEEISQTDLSNTDIVINAIDMFATLEYLYVLSSNNKLNQFLTGQKGKGSTVFKLDWDGEILAQYNLGVDANSFGVDESRNRFYVALNENDENPIVYFDFE